MVRCLLLVGVLLCATTSWGAEPTAGMTAYEKQLNALAGKKLPVAKKLEQIYQMMWDHTMQSQPETATFVGYPGQNDRWTDMSVDAISIRQEEDEYTLKTLRGIKPTGLKGEELVSYQLAISNLEMNVDATRFHDEYLAITQEAGAQIDVTELLFNAPKTKLQDYRDILTRLNRLPAYLQQIQILLTAGVATQTTQPKVILAKVPDQFKALVPDDIEKSPLYDPFKDMPKDIAAADQDLLRKEAKSVLQDKVYPAYKQLQKYVVEQYIPHCRDSIGLFDLPNGTAWYNHRIKYHTTTNMTADQIHELGLKEVARIEGEMNKIREEVGFKGDLPAFFNFLRDDAQFTPKSAADLMIGYRDIAKRIDPELPRLFGRLPRLTYGVREMPALQGPAAPSAYYEGGTLDAGRAGYFEANTYNLKARPTWAMEALTLHEAVPGHHLQLSIAQELEGLPEFRKNTGPTAFVEGWGLYAESLGTDIGLYKDPYSKMGRLGFEIWRAARLVMDTGIHAKGWTRDQALAYFRQHTPIAEGQVISETDRYIADAGQALAYKIGELKFQELKAKARAAWGEKFDIRKFHDMLLGSGALPLSVIEAKMAAWVPGASNSADKANKSDKKSH